LVEVAAGDELGGGVLADADGQLPQELYVGVVEVEQECPHGFLALGSVHEFLPNFLIILDDFLHLFNDEPGDPLCD
jgi:hypothetical protein